MKSIYILLCFCVAGFFLFCRCTPDAQKKAIEQEKEHGAPKNNSSLIIEKEPVPYQSDITCPVCSHICTEKLPTEVCVIKYVCPTCKTNLYPKEGDCCVFCSYGSVRCPSKQ